MYIVCVNMNTKLIIKINIASAYNCNLHLYYFHNSNITDQL